MNAHPCSPLASLLLAATLGTPALTLADHPVRVEIIRADADGFQVVPSQNSGGTAKFHATFDRAAHTITYELAWKDLKGGILQSHIHFGSRASNGDIVLFLCLNPDPALNLKPPPPPASTPPACAGTSGTVTGVLDAEDLIALAFGGIQPGQQLLPFANFDELADAIDAEATYVVVHTQAQPPW